MAITSPMTLDDAADTQHVFQRLSTTAAESVWMDVATNLAEPTRLRIRHESPGRGVAVVDRHNLNLVITDKDANGVPWDLAVNFTVSIPRLSHFSSAQAKNAILIVINALIDNELDGGFSNMSSVDDLLIGVM
jgi:hypothetical protein